MSLSGYPPWVVLHIPHDSTYIPDQVRSQYLLSDQDLALELQRMTDHFTHALFAEPPGDATVVRAPVSRLVVDVERFAKDDQEPMAARGMGAVYTLTSQKAPLRRVLGDAEREVLLQRYYRSHHDRLEAAVSNSLEEYNHCLVVDCHSFPSIPLPYEQAEHNAFRPDICIGTDDFHTNPELATEFSNRFQSEGWQVCLNDPFAGALVPSSRYRRDRRVGALMVEVNRRLYLQESEAIPLSNFREIAQRITNCCMAAIATCRS